MRLILDSMLKDRNNGWERAKKVEAYQPKT